MAYDAASRLTSATDKDSRRIDYAYDNDNRLTAQTWRSSTGSVTNNVTYSYDNDRELLTAQDSSGTVTMGFDALGRETVQTDVWGLTLTYVYDSADRMTQRQDSLNGVLTNAYDTANRPTSVQFGGTSQTQMRVNLGYDYRNELSSLSRYADVAGLTSLGSASYSYDSAGRVTSIFDKNSGVATLAYYNYAYDASDRVTSHTWQGATSGTQSYTYDVNSQLLSDSTNSFAYDANGNRTNAGYSTGTGNEMTNDGTWTYTYDAEGNTTKKSKGSGLETVYYGYDDRNRLTSVLDTSNGTTTVTLATYTYDVLNRRVQESKWKSMTGTVTTRHAFDGQNIWADLDGSNSLLARYFYGDHVNQILARTIPTGKTNAGLAYYFTDRLGSVRDLMDSTQTVRDHIDRNGYGAVITETNAAYGDEFGYAGGLYDRDLKTVDFENRVYDPATGRWNRRDPKGLGPDANPFRYAGNDPANETDPSGLISQDQVEATLSPEVGVRLSENGEIAKPDPTNLYRYVASSGLAGRSICIKEIEPPPPNKYSIFAMDGRSFDKGFKMSAWDFENVTFKWKGFNFKGDVEATAYAHRRFSTYLGDNNLDNFESVVYVEYSFKNLVRVDGGKETKVPDIEDAYVIAYLPGVFIEPTAMRAPAPKGRLQHLINTAFGCGLAVLITSLLGLVAETFPDASNPAAQAAELPAATKDLLIWREPIGDSSGSPTAYRGVVLIGTNNSAPRDPRAKDDRGVLLCFQQATGTFLGQVTHPRLAKRANDVRESGLRSRPCGDENRIYYFSNRAELVCLNLDSLGAGKAADVSKDKQSPTISGPEVSWKLDMQAKLGVFKRDAGERGNPLPSVLVVGDLVYCVTGNGSTFGCEDDFPGADFVPKPQAPSFIAVDKKTGDIVWSSDAPGKNILYGQWASPALARVGGADQILFPGGDGWLYGFAAQSGRLIWKVDCNQPAATKWGPQQRGTRSSFLAAPVVRDEVAYLGVNQDQETSDDVRRPVYAVDVTQKGDATKTAIKWTFDGIDFRGGTFGDVALGEDAVYVLGASGILYCLDPKTGKEQWKSRLGRSARRFSSPCVVGGKVFASADRTLFVYADDRERKPVGRYDLDSDIEGTPAIIKDRVFVATRKYLYCLRIID